MEFNGLTFLLLLCGLEIVKPSSGCPKLCTCINKEVNCNNVIVNTVPTEIPSDTVLINLENNHISWINKDTFDNLSELKVLRLANNRINKIEAGAFDDLKSLMKLDLAKNEICDLPLEIFSELTSLEILYLYQNKVGI